MTTQIFGILNITTDSFSDGGQYIDPDKAIAQAHHLLDAGADVLDIGPASSNPDAEHVSPEEEVARLTPVLRALKGQEHRLSIDTFQTETQRFALAQGVAFLNDIQGFADPAFYPELADADARLVVMHSIQRRGIATRTDSGVADMLEHIIGFFEDRFSALEKAGVARHRLVLDPGMGFFLGSDPAVSFQVLMGLERLKHYFGVPVLVSVSRKSFLRKVTGRDPSEAGPASQAAELLAAQQGTDFIRTHEPAPLKDVLAVLSALPRAAS